MVTRGGSDPHRRLRFHDYGAEGAYLVTLTVRRHLGPVAELTDAPDGPRFEPTRLGRLVAEGVEEAVSPRRSLHLFKLVLMTHTVHIMMRVDYSSATLLDERIDLIRREVRRRAGTEVFDPVAFDRPIHPQCDVTPIVRFLDEAPLRAKLLDERARAMFGRVIARRVADRACHTMGNPHLLSNPFCRQVVVHRSDSPADREIHLDSWLHLAANRGVLVGPFISEAERRVLDAAAALGGRAIMIVHTPLSEGMPLGPALSRMLAQGRLLLVSPDGLPPLRSRKLCLDLNDFALALCGDNLAR